MPDEPNDKRLRAAAEQFMTLFPGSPRASGTHGEPERAADGLKWTIKKTARHMHYPASVELWMQHLSGERPLGVIPIRDDSMCAWGSIDFDEYDVDLRELLERVEQSGLPLVPCRSKSGGLHLFPFLKDFEPAEDMQKMLRDAAASLGMAECEIFPKQTKIMAERNDMGNWMIMPYFGGDFGGKLKMQRGLKFKTGADMTMEEFIKAAHGALTTTREFVLKCEQRRTPTVVRSTNGAAHHKGDRSRADFANGPPCLQHMATQGFPSDGRKRALFMIGIYLKRSDQHGWRDKMEAENQIRWGNNPLPSSEVTQDILSLSKKNYEYTCKEEPMRSHCNSQLCRARKFGVGAGEEAPFISNMRKLESDPPIWFVDVVGRDGETAVLEMDTETLFNYPDFMRAAMKKCTITYKTMKQATWLGIVSVAMKDCTVLNQPDQLPPDLTAAGKFHELLEEYLTNTAKGQRREDLLRHVPWDDEENGRRYFTTKGFLADLERQRLRDKIDTKHIFRQVEKLGGGFKQQLYLGLNNGKHKNINTYWIPIDAVNETPMLPGPEPREDKI